MEDPGDGPPESSGSLPNDADDELPPVWGGDEIAKRGRNEQMRERADEGGADGEMSVGRRGGERMRRWERETRERVARSGGLGRDERVTGVGEGAENKSV
jgi:hypothetical protein